MRNSIILALALIATVVMGCSSSRRAITADLKKMTDSVEVLSTELNIVKKTLDLSEKYRNLLTTNLQKYNQYSESEMIRVLYDTSKDTTLQDWSDATEETTTVNNSFGKTITVEYGKTYYIKAFATNSQGTAYGEEISFITENPHTAPNSPVLSNNISVSAYINWNEPSDLGNGTLTGYKIERKSTTSNEWDVIVALQVETSYSEIITESMNYRVTTITLEYGEGEPSQVITANYPSGGAKVYYGSFQVVIN